MKLNLDLFGFLFFDRHNCILATDVWRPASNVERSCQQRKPAFSVKENDGWRSICYLFWSRVHGLELKICKTKNVSCFGSEMTCVVNCNLEYGKLRSCYWRNGLNFDWWLRSRKTFPVIDFQDSSSPINAHVVSTSLQMYPAAWTKRATQLVVIKRLRQRELGRV